MAVLRWGSADRCKLESAKTFTLSPRFFGWAIALFPQPDTARLDEIRCRDAASGNPHQHCQHLVAALQTDDRVACFRAPPSANRQISKGQPAGQPNAIAPVLKIGNAVNSCTACQQERIAAATAAQGVVACAAIQQV